MTDGTAAQLARVEPPKQVLSVIPGELLHAIEAFCAAETLCKRRNSFVQIVRWTRHGRGTEPPRERYSARLFHRALLAVQEMGGATC